MVNEPFVLIVPTYEDEITYPVTEFLEYANNACIIKRDRRDRQP